MNLLTYLKKTGCEKNLARLIGEIIPAAIIKVRAAIEADVGAKAGSQNITGDAQLALDIRANDIFLKAFSASDLVAAAASEELDDAVIFSAQAPFTVAFDPLDGSSLADVNFAVGSIIGIYPSAVSKHVPNNQFLGRTGDEQLASLIVIYGPRTSLLVTVKKGVHEFVASEKGEFNLTRENLIISEDTKYFAPGNLRACVERKDYFDLITNFIKRGLTLRYSGGMVPDINHMLLKGSGIFTYPGYKAALRGKLRLLFECSPVALLAEQAHGAATDGAARILAQKIIEIHQRTPILVGSKNAVAEAQGALAPQPGRGR